MAASLARTSAGTTLAISPAPAQILNGSSYLLTDFTALSFTVVGEISDLGSFGKKYNLVTFNPLGDRKTVKRKGSYNNGTLSLKMAAAPTNAGQVVLTTASNDDASYCFRVITQSGSTYYFTGQVMGFQLEVGSVDQIMGASADVELDNDILIGNIVA